MEPYGYQIHRIPPVYIISLEAAYSKTNTTTSLCDVVYTYSEVIYYDTKYLDADKNSNEASTTHLVLDDPGIRCVLLGGHNIYNR